MRLFVLLLVISAADLAFSDGNGIPNARFPFSVLQPDLDAIEEYHKSTKNYLDAWIYWPDDIVFHVRREEVDGEAYLRVGNVKDKLLFGLYIPNKNGLFYKDGKFHFKCFKWTMILANDMKTYYDYSPAQPKGQYLSIRYKSLDEVKEAIEPFYTDHKSFLYDYSENSPSTYLATWDGQRHFLEYTLWRELKPTVEADGNLRILIGKKDKNGIWNLHQTLESTKIVFNPKEKTVAIPFFHHIALPYQRDVFGVRMESIGFLEEVQGDNFKMLSAADITSGSVKSLTAHFVSVKDFLNKVKIVEPKTCDSDDDVCLRFCPKTVKFQLHGHVLIKYVNYLDEGKSVNKECPLGIKNELEGARFEIGGGSTKEICTDNIKIWGGRFSGNSSIEEDEVIALFYPSN